ncbi:Cas10/Cmr2 second palm domain-containing protein [Sphaerothrix gracilis]|uniref:Cas10/Cmr2 second palm domain-containing protein n=1 Tax=Sphaerothrix gracilis TaxID=3151835 RepID=UPI0031FDC255
MTASVYTAITFAPVQGFIEKSRKLRDLYGSSIILSYLADAICAEARTYFEQPEHSPWPDDPVISPARINVARGTPNQIIVRGRLPKENAKAALDKAWKTLVNSCRCWIESNVVWKETESANPEEAWNYYWERAWREWSNHNWEFFWATGDSIEAARAKLNQVKYARAWTGINWVGESSTLTGLDSRAWPTLGFHKSHERSKQAEENEVKAFYRQLSQAIVPPANDDAELNESIITPREQLSIPELIKRLVTIEAITGVQSQLELPRSFSAINRWKSTTTAAEDTDGTEDADRAESSRWTGWFQGDGDRAGKYLQSLSNQVNNLTEKEEILHTFSQQMRQWGWRLNTYLPPAPDRRARERSGRSIYNGRIIYAGGDDFLGVLYRNPPEPELRASECLEWFYRFKPEIWQSHQQPISVSVGFVWAAPRVPQRDVLQHCRLAEKSAKNQGRDRLALRVLFNGGNHLEWGCPWRFLPVLQDYIDRTPQNGTDQWTHLYNDVATLEARHAFAGSQSIVALRLFQVYFTEAAAFARAEQNCSAWQVDDRQSFYELMSSDALDLEHPALWNQVDPTTHQITGGLLGDRDRYLTAEQQLDTTQVHQAVNQWIINLAKVGFHLCRSHSNT